MAKVKHPSPQDVAGLWVDEYFGNNPGFVYMDDFYNKPTITKEPSILQKYTVSNDVRLEITDVPGGYSFVLFLDGVSVWSRTHMGVTGRIDTPLTYTLPIIVAIKKEKESV